MNFANCKFCIALVLAFFLILALGDRGQAQISQAGAEQRCRGYPTG